MVIVRCDARGCPAEFRSCSLPKMIDQQALLAGWSLIEIEEKNRWGSLAWLPKDLCPAHRPTQGGTIDHAHWRERAVKGKAGSVSGRSRVAH